MDEKVLRDALFNLKRIFVGMALIERHGHSLLTGGLPKHKMKQELVQVLKHNRDWMNSRARRLIAPDRQHLLNDFIEAQSYTLMEILDESVEITNFVEEDLEYLLMQWKTLIILHNGKGKSSQNSSGDEFTSA